MKRLRRQARTALVILLLAAVSQTVACTGVTAGIPAAAEDPALRSASSSPVMENVVAQDAVDPKPDLQVSLRPNIVLITMDTLRADAVGAYGNERLQTPNIDSLAREGTRFDLAITPMPQTNPTHASIFTGMYPSGHRLFRHMSDMLSPDVRPIAQILSDYGYRTAGHYSWISFDPEYSGLERGFAAYHKHTVDRPWNSEDKPDWYEQYLDSKANVTTDGVLSWADSNDSEPFFLWVHYNDTHWPYEPPAPFDRMFSECDTCLDGSMDSIIKIAEGYSPTAEEIAHLRGLYDGEAAFQDQQFGRIITWLRDKGILDETLVIVTADHGDGFGENGLWSHQSVLYNTAARVPLIIRFPGLVPDGQVVDSAVSTTDIFPTILQILAIDTPDRVEGRSLIPLMLGMESGDDREVFSHLWDGGRASIVYQGMKLIYDRETGRRELFDLRRDVNETIDLVRDRPDVVRDLGARLDTWLQEQGFIP